MITLAMEAYSGAPEQWEAQFESQTHGSQEGTLIRNKTPMTLLNGMPAMFVEVAYGGGFDARKEYAIVWADGAARDRAIGNDANGRRGAGRGESGAQTGDGRALSLDTSRSVERRAQVVEQIVERLRSRPRAEAGRR